MQKLREVFELNPDLELLFYPTVNELSGLAETIRTLRIQYQNNINNNEIAFRLAVALISHSRLSFVEEGVHIMEILISTQWQNRWRKAFVQQSELSPTPTPSPSFKNDKNKPAITVQDEHSEVGSALTNSILKDCEISSAKWSMLDGVVSEDHPCIDLQYGMRCAENPQTPSSESEIGKVTNKPSDNTGDVLSRSQRNDDLHVFHYYLTLGWIKLKDLKRASTCITQMLILEPSNRQGQALRTYIQAAQRQETAKHTTMIVGLSTALTGIAVALSAFLRGREPS
ncbi:unnamed protein product [Phytomonas sp. Hart1]|nr:unnamed protein product [Phytomonas sp. Hart1]|eukprot:CCW70033.1 unnamed protein product [Phytomonas sp. isolate Hart1]